MSSSAGPSRVSRPRKSSAATWNGSTASWMGTADGARTGGSEMRGWEDCDAMPHYLGLPGLNRTPSEKAKCEPSLRTNRTGEGEPDAAKQSKAQANDWIASSPGLRGTSTPTA